MLCKQTCLCNTIILKPYLLCNNTFSYLTPLTGRCCCKLRCMTSDKLFVQYKFNKFQITSATTLTVYWPRLMVKEVTNCFLLRQINMLCNTIIVIPNNFCNNVLSHLTPPIDRCCCKLCCVTSDKLVMQYSYSNAESFLQQRSQSLDIFHWSMVLQKIMLCDVRQICYAIPL